MTILKKSPLLKRQRRTRQELQALQKAVLKDGVSDPGVLMNMTIRGKKAIADLRLKILDTLERPSLTQKERQSLTNFLSVVEQVIKINGKSIRFWGEPLCRLLFDA